MIITRRATFFLGIFIFVIPFLGFPSIWKMGFTVISGIALIILSVKINLPRKSSPKVRKERPVEFLIENVPPPPPPLPPEPIPTPIKPPVVPKVTKVSEVKPRKRVSKKSNGPVS
jgi:hypothetical protein